MKNTHYRLSSLLLAVIMIASVVPMQAASSDIVPYRYDYDYVSNCSISLNITSKGLSTSAGNITLRRGVNAEMTVTLYKSTDKRNWDYVTSWDTSGSSILMIEKNYYVMSGYYYKAELSADVYNSSGSFLENVTSTSSIKYY